MKQHWVVVVLIWYICVNENYLFTRADYLTTFNFNEKSMSISCYNSTLIRIRNIYVGEESVPCGDKKICDLNDLDIRNIKQCNGKNECVLERRWTTACIREYRYYNISYICNATCDFEQSECGFSKTTVSVQWRRVTGNNITVENNNTSINITDHTTGTIDGQFMVVTSDGKNTATMVTQPLQYEGNTCLSFWYFSLRKTQHSIALIILQQNDTFRRVELEKGIDWHFNEEDIYLKDSDVIGFQTDPTNEINVLIGLDDISIANYECNQDGAFPIVRPCVSTGDFFTVTECPTFFLNSLNIKFIHDLTRDNESSQACQDTDYLTQNIHKECATYEWELCSFNLSTIINDTTCLHLDKEINIKYSCSDENVSSSLEMTTHQLQNTKDSTILTTIDRQSFSTLLQTDDTTIDNQATSTSSKIDAGIPSTPPSSSPVIGVVVGVVLSLVVLSVCLIIAVIYVRRSRYAEKKGHSIVSNEDSHSDYTGHQNIAFSPEVNVTTQTDYSDIRKSKLNEHYHDISDTFSPSINKTNDDEYSEIANVVNSLNSNPNPSTNYQHQYISLDPNATGFNRSNPQTNLHNESKNNHNSNDKTSFTGGDDYAILDPDDLNESKNNTPKVLPLSDNYVVLDPNETGFNRQENTDRVCNYDLATPTVTSEDPYDVSKDETYDTSSNSRHKEKENNIYSHTVDNVYDTAGNQRKKEESDSTYDHFFGQKSEDDYDISKPI